MSNPLTDARAAAVSALESAGIDAFSVVPEVVTPPIVWVAPGDPYVSFEGAAAFGGRVVRLQVVGAVEAGVNDVQAEALDALALQICDAIEATEQFGLDDVGQPGQVSLNGQSYLAVPIAITTQIWV